MGTEDARTKDSAQPAVVEPTLRQRAEDKARHLDLGDEGTLSPEAVRQLVHELRVHQIELEMQNEELRRTQEVLEASQARYFDLYDLAPVGYITLSEKGLILEANLTAATLLDVPRGALVKQPLTRWVVAEDQDGYYLYRNRLLETGTPQVCELRMLRQEVQVSQFWVRLVSCLGQDEESGAQVCRVTMSDITERKQAIGELQGLAHELGERVKELDCLYSIANLVETPGCTLEEILQGAAELIPPAWKYPEVACARILLDGQEYRTDSFAQSPWQHSADILVEGKKRGTIQVGYLQKQTAGDEDPFLREERNLLGAIAGRLGAVVERMHAQEQIRQQQQFLQTVLDSLAYPLYVINVADRTVELANRAATADRLQGKLTCYALLHGCEQHCEGANHPCPLEEIQRTKNPVVVEHVHLDRHGHRQYVEVHGFPITNSEGNVVQMIEYTRDITERKEADLAVRESESRWRSLTQTSPDHILMLDTDLSIQFANYASPGLTIDDLIGKPLHSLVDEAQQGQVRNILENVLRTGAPARYETIYSSTDGSDIHYESHATARVLPDTDQIVGLAISSRDITLHKQAEQALRDSEAKLRALFDILPVGISVLDHSRTIQLANPALTRILHLSQDQLQQGTYEGRTYLGADGTEMAPGELPSMRAVRERQPVRDMEIGVVSDDGEQIWTSVSAAPLPFEDWRVIVATADITRLKGTEVALQKAHSELEQRVAERTAELQALNQQLRAEITERERVEADLRSSEERFRQLAEHVNHVFWISDLTDNRILYVSPAYEDLTGRARSALYEQPSAILDSVHLEDRQRMARALEQGSREEQVGEYRLVRADGSVVWVRVRTFPVRDEQGKIYRLAGIAEDITEQVEAVQLLELHVEERTRQLSTLLQIAGSMTLTLELDQLLDEILDGLRDVVEFDSAIIYELEDEQLVALAHRGRSSSEELGLGARSLQLVDSAIAQEMMANQKPVLISDVRGPMDDGLLVPFSDWACCGIAVPLRIRQRPTGLLILYSSLPQSYSWRQASLLLALANQVAVSIENARLYEQTGALAVLEERQRLSRDLHDAVSQTLFSANIIAEALPRLWERDPEGVRSRLPQLHRLTTGALAEMRTLLLELRPNALVDVGLGELLRQAVDAFSGRSRTVAWLTLAGRRPLPEAVQIALYRIAQEALSNVAKHAKANEVRIHLQMEPDRVELCVRDDGQGFEPDEVPPASMGLRILSERAKAVGAELQIKSRPGNGTEVLVTWTETL